MKIVALKDIISYVLKNVILYYAKAVARTMLEDGTLYYARRHQLVLLDTDKWRSCKKVLVVIGFAKILVDAGFARVLIVLAVQRVLIDSGITKEYW